MNLDNLTPEEITYLRAMAFKDKDYATTLQRMLGVPDDGKFGKQSKKALQSELGVKADGIIGKKSKQAFHDRLDEQLIEAVRHNVAKERGDTEWTNAFYDLPEEQSEYNRKFEYPRLALVNKEIEDLKKQIAERKERQAPQPNTRVGWASYIIEGDRGLLDKYADAERVWYNKLKDQELSKELAYAQRREQRAINLNSARDTLAKLQIMKDNAQQQGHDTRQIDLQMASIYRDYPELSIKDEVTKEYDPRKAVEYVIADVEDIDDNNTQEEIKEAQERISKFNTPESIKVLNKLDKALANRIKKEESQETYNNEIKSWINGGDTTKYLYNLGMETQFADDKERLVNKKTGRVVAERPRNRTTTPTPRTTPTSKPSKSSWEL